MHPALRTALAALLAVWLAACAAAPEPVPAAPPPFPWELAERGEAVPSSVPLEQILPGGPPPDGIPPIDEPRFEPVDAAAGWLDERDPVLVVEVDGVARAYPLAILTFHEIVNDTLAGRPVVVTYCPLCNSALAFDRRVGDEVLDFGTSGRLWNSNLVMYDRATRSLWAQFTGEAIVGDRLGTVLERLPVQLVGFGDYAAARPDGEVLSRETGVERPYGQNPYAGYDRAATPFLYEGETGGPLPQIERVVTTGGETDPVAYPLTVLQRERVVHDLVGGRELVVWWTPGTASALDTGTIAAGRDVGASGVFVPVVDGDPLTFAADGDEAFVDAETGSRWNVLGQAVQGPLRGSALESVPHDDTFWFVQYAFRPGTRVFARVSGAGTPPATVAGGR